jgi:hypothetical protein
VELGVREGLEALAVAAGEVLALLDQASGRDADCLGALRRLEAAERIVHGVKLRVLAEADRRRAVRAGVGAWLAAELGYSSSRARGLAEEARRIGALPELAGRLCAGGLNQDQTRVVSRAVKAARGSGIEPGAVVAEVLAVMERDGVAGARARVRVLEETLAPGTAKDRAVRQRACSFLRVGESGDGMVRIDALLDAQRGTVVRAVVDQLVAGWIRSRQYDGVEVLPGDVATTEQMGAQALTRLAEVYSTASEEQRAGVFAPKTLYVAQVPGPMRNIAVTVGIPAGCARTVYGELVPAEGLPPMRNSAAASVLVLDPVSGEPVLLDGRGLDVDPGARLASPDQRTALEFRDGQCSEPGCTRPVTWSLHAHHVIAFRDGGETTMRNLALLCSEHHVLRHHPGHDIAA